MSLASFCSLGPRRLDSGRGRSDSVSCVQKQKKAGKKKRKKKGDKKKDDAVSTTAAVCSATCESCCFGHALYCVVFL